MLITLPPYLSERRRILGGISNKKMYTDFLSRDDLSSVFCIIQSPFPLVDRSSTAYSQPLIFSGIVANFF